jgi:hypothetical protein
VTVVVVVFVVGFLLAFFLLFFFFLTSLLVVFSVVVGVAVVGFVADVGGAIGGRFDSGGTFDIEIIGLDVGAVVVDVVGGVSVGAVIVGVIVVVDSGGVVGTIGGTDDIENGVGVVLVSAVVLGLFVELFPTLVLVDVSGGGLRQLSIKLQSQPNSGCTVAFGGAGGRGAPCARCTPGVCCGVGFARPAPTGVSACVGRGVAVFVCKTFGTA